MNLEKFLIDAQLNGYALRGEGEEIEASDGSKTLKYSDGDFEYMDKYYGFSKFIGYEIIWEKEKYKWGNSYHGELFGGIVGAKKVYEFLKECLQVEKKIWFNRGVANYKNDDFEYINDFRGNYKKFSGVERISFKSQEVFKLSYSGGIIQGRE